LDLEKIKFDNSIVNLLGTPRIFFRDALEVLKFLFGNTIFKEKMHFSAERVYDENGKRLFNEVWTSDWWWEVQVSTVSYK
jgi:Plavaka transposase